MIFMIIFKYDLKNKYVCTILILFHNIFIVLNDMFSKIN